MDATTITFEIQGDPIPQPRVRWANGRTYTPTKNGIKVYKQAITLRAAMEAKRRGWGLSLGPHEIDVEAVFVRPPSHLAKHGGLRSTAPLFPGRNCGDNDNIEKAVWDAVTASGAVWGDDTQIVANSCRKRYGSRARTVITIRRPS
jgi:Holliday junction resolvase RusA-like endonuclease